MFSTTVFKYAAISRLREQCSFLSNIRSKWQLSLGTRDPCWILCLGLCVAPSMRVPPCWSEFVEPLVWCPPLVPSRISKLRKQSQFCACLLLSAKWPLLVWWSSWVPLLCTESPKPLEFGRFNCSFGRASVARLSSVISVSSSHLTSLILEPALGPKGTSVSDMTSKQTNGLGPSQKGGLGKLEVWTSNKEPVTH